MKAKLILLVVALMLTACAPSVPAIQTAIVQTQAAWTPIPTQTPYPTYTPFPTATSVPLPTSTPTTAAATNKFAWNYIASQESGGITLEIARVLIAEKLALGSDFDKRNRFDGVPIIGEIIFKITNTSDKTISIYPDQGTVIVLTEQIDLREWMLFGTFGDDIGGDIYPGITKIGGIYFGVKRATLAEINGITIIVTAPHDENFNTLGGEFKFELDLSQRKNDPIPDELK